MVFERKLFGRSRRRFWARFPELQSRVHSNVFIKNIVYEKNFFSISPSVLRRSFSVFSAKVLQHSWQKFIFYVRRNNWWKTNFSKKQILLNNYGFSSFCFWDLTRSFNRVAKTSYYMPNQLFEEKHFFWTKV